MTPSTLTTGKPSDTNSKRYRLPGITREGIAQLSILETALWPVQGGNLDSATFETRYKYQTEAGAREANVTVYAPRGLQSIDEYVLWGLLGMSINHKNPNNTLMATPYWIIKKLGMSMGGAQYIQLRDSLERLALVAYQNTAFYNPLTQEHERVTFHFFSAYLPTRDRGASVDNDRSWRIEWSPTFFKMCHATGGTLLFDLELYRALSPAARRLFLKLKDRFWRSKHVFFNVDDLTIHGLGFSATRPLKKRKFDLTKCIEELLQHGVVELGRGQFEAKDLFLKRSKGVYVVQLHEGPYFRTPLSTRAHIAKESHRDDPLYEPLKKIGVDEPGIRRLLSSHSRGVLQRWINVTEVAMNERPRGFPGFKTSPAAFLVDAVQNNRLPPEWMHDHQRATTRREWENRRREQSMGESIDRLEYERAKAQALDELVKSAECAEVFKRYVAVFRGFYAVVDPNHVEESATKAARDKIAAERLMFPEYGVWLLEKQSV